MTILLVLPESTSISHPLFLWEASLFLETAWLCLVFADRGEFCNVKIKVRCILRVQDFFTQLYEWMMRTEEEWLSIPFKEMMVAFVTIPLSVCWRLKFTTHRNDLDYVS
jgi:hypothetical protein